MASDDEPEPLFVLGEQCGLHIYADYPDHGLRWWNVFVIAIATSLIYDGDLIQLAIGDTPDETDRAAMTQQVTIRVSTSGHSLRPGWILPRTNDRHDDGHDPADDQNGSARGHGTAHSYDDEKRDNYSESPPTQAQCTTAYSECAHGAQALTTTQRVPLCFSTAQH